MKTPKLNIILMSTHLNIGGIAVYVVSLAKALAKKGHKVTVISSGGDMEMELAKAGIRHRLVDIRTKSELSPKLWFAFSKIAAILKEEKPDIIHAQTRVTQVLGYLVARRFRIPCVTTCHGFFKRRISRRVFDGWGNSVIAISEAVRNHLVSDFGVSRSRIELIHNGVDVKRFRKKFFDFQVKETRRELGLKEELVVGAIGRLSPVKGVGNLISAFASSPSLRKKARLVIVGDGPEKTKLVTSADALGLGDKVSFLKSDLDTPRLLAAMDVFVFPSVQEGLGLSLIEAMASGKAIVATDVGGIGTLIKDNETGLLAKPGNERNLAASIDKLLVDKRLRDKLSRNARELARREFSLDKMADKVEGLYEKVIVKTNR